MQDMFFFRLTGNDEASRRRARLGKILGIGYGNTAAFLSRLNSFGISKEEFVQAIKQIDNIGSGER